MKSWWRGEDSNLRRLSRQIYSLLPLAAREPLHCPPNWSQRRESNPRPTDYKSVALPSELRWLSLKRANDLFNFLSTQYQYLNLRLIREYMLKCKQYPTQSASCVEFHAFNQKCAFLNRNFHIIPKRKKCNQNLQSNPIIRAGSSREQGRLACSPEKSLPFLIDFFANFI
jgi:hypothetical protein